MTKKFNEDHKLRIKRLFTSSEMDVMLFTYDYGKSDMFIKFKKTREREDVVTAFGIGESNYKFGVWYELPGGMGTRHGYEEIYSTKFPLAPEYRMRMYTKTEDQRNKDARVEHIVYRAAAVIFFKESSEHNWVIFDQVNDGKVLLDVMEETYETLPDDRRIEYNYVVKNSGIMIVTDNLDYNSTYESYRLFIGNIQEGLKSVKITEFERFRDGGTTIIRTDAGLTIFKPTAFSNNDSGCLLFDNLEAYTKWEPYLDKAIKYKPSEMYLKYVTGNADLPAFVIERMTDEQTSFVCDALKILNEENRG